MNQLTINTPDSNESLNAVRSILVQYAGLRRYDEALGDFQQELNLLPGKYGSPDGCLLLAFWRDIPAGVVAYQTIENGICEMKRMFVLPDFQGKGIGKALAQRLIDEVKKAGFSSMKLDTHPWMTTAQGLYEKLGFQETERYNDNPTEGIRFFELTLSKASH